MGITDILRMAGGLGPTVALIALILAIGVGIGILVSTVKRLSSVLEQQNCTFMKTLKDLKEESDKRDDRLEQLIANQGLRISYIEQRFASKEEMYEALGGWRHEVERLNERINRHVEKHGGC